MSGKNKRFRGLNLTLTVLTVCVLAAAAVLGMGTALGWFKRTVVTPGGETGAGTFEVRTVAWFDAGGNPPVQLDVGKLIDVELRDASAANYVGKLRVKSIVTSDMVFALRLSVFNFWFQDDTVPRLNPMPFTMPAGSVIDNARRDSSYYRCDVAAYTMSDYEASVFSDFYLPPCSNAEFEFITGVDESKLSDYETNVQLKVRLQSEIIQANSIKRMWNSVPPPVAAPV